jgi:hypothetical protein
VHQVHRAIGQRHLLGRAGQNRGPLQAKIRHPSHGPQAGLGVRLQGDDVGRLVMEPRYVKAGARPQVENHPAAPGSQPPDGGLDKAGGIRGLVLQLVLVGVALNVGGALDPAQAKLGFGHPDPSVPATGARQVILHDPPPVPPPTRGLAARREYGRPGGAGTQPVKR